MSAIMKVFLLLAVLVCISKAQMDRSGSSCLCSKISKGLNGKSKMKDIRIYKESNSCSRVEIIVTMTDNKKYCLDPTMKSVQKLIANLMKRNARATIRGVSTSTPESTTTEGP